MGIVLISNEYYGHAPCLQYCSECTFNSIFIECGYMYAADCPVAP